MTEKKTGTGKSIEQARKQVEGGMQEAMSFLRRRRSPRERRAALKLPRKAPHLMMALIPAILRSPWLLPLGRTASQLQDLYEAMTEMALFVNSARALADEAEDSHRQMMEELWRTLLDAYSVARRTGGDPA